MAIANLRDLFLHTLKDIYFAEQTIAKKLPKFAEKATSSRLKALFETHLAETNEHIARLENIFEMLGEESRAEECPAIQGITEEADELAQEIEDPETRDAAMLAAAQAVEHYEITRYGTLIAWAEEIGEAEVIGILQTTLDEEKAADQELSQLAEGRLNRQAAA